MATDPYQYYPRKMRKSSEFTIFTTKSDSNVESEGLYLVSNNQEKTFIHLIYPFDIEDKASVIVVTLQNPNSKIALILDSKRVTLNASFFNVTPNTSIIYNEKDIVILNFNDALGLKDRVRAIEADTSKPNIVYVVAGNTLYVFQIENLRQPWKSLGSVSNNQFPNYTYNCRIRKITNYLAVDCYTTGVLARFDVSDVRNPLNSDYLALREYVVDLGLGRFIYSITKPSWRCQLTIYDVLTKNISLRFRSQLQALDTCYVALPVTSASLDYPNDLFFLYTYPTLHIYRFSKSQELVAKIPKVQDPTYSECYQTKPSCCYECAYSLNLQSYCDLTPQNLTLNLKLNILLPPNESLEALGTNKSSRDIDVRDLQNDSNFLL